MGEIKQLSLWTPNCCITLIRVTRPNIPTLSDYAAFSANTSYTSPKGETNGRMQYTETELVNNPKVCFDYKHEQKLTFLTTSLNKQEISDSIANLEFKNERRHWGHKREADNRRLFQVLNSFLGS